MCPIRREVLGLYRIFKKRHMGVGGQWWRLKRMARLSNLFPEKLTPESERSKVDQKRTGPSHPTAGVFEQRSQLTARNTRR